MTTTFFLVRHAAHDRVGTILCGRMAGVCLGSVGKVQAERLAHRFANENVTCICTSPLERAMETAQPIARRLGQPVQVCDAINEINFGRWTGASFKALNENPLWASWNRSRSTSRPPKGETMREAQGRIVGAMEQLRSLHAERSVILVSHSDVIKAALLYHLGMPIDAYGRLEIEPASISTLVVGEWGSKILRLNEVVAA
ncbi:histidine phosphatase family protein [Microvirga sp. 3-52]|uniref:histidine phosphatase family protein n=1 Tax=Microvirga sp. 3-52 TaxID=2792425 RepID=UPI001ACBBE39|nr:histidine phosphatase family protein [Microvirga sp. 3-52]MBO1908566.1 histidine phosphatase family protein [Microvirga sp. 3-52]MBS7455032.1 histidine phosphatase family protein [Microvirga sp. 3-52]